MNKDPDNLARIIPCSSCFKVIEYELRRVHRQSEVYGYVPLLRQFALQWLSVHSRRPKQRVMTIL